MVARAASSHSIAIFHKRNFSVPHNNPVTRHETGDDSFEIARMATLAQIQDIFSTAVFDVERSLPSSIKQVGTPANTKVRFDVYRNNVFVALIDMIEARFPVVLRLVGDEFFRGVARSYVKARPPGMQASIQYGATFADFLKTFPPVEDLPYLPDVAALEWACHEARFAKDEPAPAISDAQQRLASAARDVTPKIRFHAATRCIKSKFPVHAIWETNTHDDEVKKVSSDLGGQDVLIARPKYEVQVALLPAGGADFIDAISHRKSISQALDYAEANTQDISLQDILVCLLSAGAIAEITI